MIRRKDLSITTENKKEVTVINGVKFLVVPYTYPGTVLLVRMLPDSGETVEPYLDPNDERDNILLNKDWSPGSYEALPDPD